MPPIDPKRTFMRLQSTNGTPIELSFTPKSTKNIGDGSDSSVGVQATNVQIKIVGPSKDARPEAVLIHEGISTFTNGRPPQQTNTAFVAKFAGYDAQQNAHIGTLPDFPIYTESPPAGVTSNFEDRLFVGIGSTAAKGPADTAIALVDPLDPLSGVFKLNAKAAAIAQGTLPSIGS
jgi:hypothetical protein